MRTKLANAFSLSMVPAHCELAILPLPVGAVMELVEEGVESFIGHADTATLLSGILGREIPMNRGNVSLVKGETMVVAQYNGPRLPEGCKTLPEGAGFRFLAVTLK